MAMTLAKDPKTRDPFTASASLENIITLPLELESNEPELESDLHRDQINQLLACLKWWWRDRNDFYATGNLTIYFNPNQLTTQDFRGPDFFVVLGTEDRPRKSWLLWAEQGKYPNVIIELLSSSTAKVDRGTKKDIYQDTFRTPEYFWFHPHTLEFKGFRLMGGKYQPLEPNEDGWLWSEQLELFLGIHGSQLRFFSPEKQLVSTPEERVKKATLDADKAMLQQEAAQQQAEAERERAEVAQQQAEAERERAEVAQQQAETERERAKVAQQQAETERERAEVAQQQAETERERAEVAQQQAEAEREQRQLLQQQLRDLQDLLKRGSAPDEL